MASASRYIRFFKVIGTGDVAEVGGKNASLGEMYGALRSQGVRVRNGLAVLAGACWYVLERAGVSPALKEVIQGLDPANVVDLAARRRKMREIVHGAGLPEDLRREIPDAHHILPAECGPRSTLAVRSSATAEALPEASFAGAHETFLDVHGDEQLLDACRRCFASPFTDGRFTIASTSSPATSTDSRLAPMTSRNSRWVSITIRRSAPSTTMRVLEVERRLGRKARADEAPSPHTRQTLAAAGSPYFAGAATTLEGTRT